MMTEQTTEDLGGVMGPGCATYEQRGIEALREIWRRQLRDQEMRIADAVCPEPTSDLISSRV